MFNPDELKLNETGASSAIQPMSSKGFKNIYKSMDNPKFPKNKLQLIAET